MMSVSFGSKRYPAPVGAIFFAQHDLHQMLLLCRWCGVISEKQAKPSVLQQRFMALLNVTFCSVYSLFMSFIYAMFIA